MGSHLSRTRGTVAALVAALAALALLFAMNADRALAQADPPACLDERSDLFDGTSLDKSRWSAILREDATLYSVSGGRLRAQTGPGEIQGGTAGAAPNIFMQPAPDGGWSATTKVNIVTNTGGQQAGVVVSDAGATNAVKAAFVNKGSGNRWLEFLPIINGQLVIEGNNWNTGNLPAEFPNEVWIRVMSDGESLSGFYSADGQVWQSIGRPLSADHIENPNAGIYALRGGAANPVVTAEFDRFDLVETDDEFDGDAIDRCRWEIQNEDATGYSIGGGQLTIQTQRGELSNNQSTVKNVFVQPTGDANWQATTKLTLDPTHSGQQGGLVVRGRDASNHSKIVLVRKENGQRWIEFLRTTNAATDFTGTWNTGYIDFPETVWVRLVSDGEQLAGYWSADGETWTKVGDSRSIAGIESPKVGLMALRGENENPAIPVSFDNFTLEPYEAPAPGCDQTAGEDQFTSIFDGTQASFDKWEHAGPGYFTLADGAMTSGNDPAAPSYGLHWFPDAQYENFTVRMQWKAEDLTDNSGVFVRFPNPGNDPNIPVNQGHEIQINENPAGDPQKTGAIYGADPAEYRNAKPVGEWNDYQITVVGQRYSVCLNGVLVNEYVSTQGRPLEGHIGVQNHDPESHVSFRNIRVQELPDEPDVQNIFDTIGITTAQNRANGQIHGTPEKYSYIAEQMPTSRSVGVPGDDDHDDVPVRMPDTRGVVPNLASMNGQQYEVTEAQRKAYSKIHFFGATTDAQSSQPSGGNFTLTFADGTTETVAVRFSDWASGVNTAAEHPAITTNPRYTTSGTQGNIDFHIFHRPIEISAANRGKVLTSITLPPNSTPGSAVTRAYLMAMTFEEANGGFEVPILAGSTEFPNDRTAPQTTATRAPGQPQGQNDWYTGPVTVTLESEDEDGGSQVEATEYRVDRGSWEQYTGEPFVIDTEGEHVVEYRAIDRAGNLESQKSMSVKIDATDPTVTAGLSPELPVGSTWYDRPVSLTIEARDGSAGSGIETTEYSVNGGGFQAYTAPVSFTQAGVYEVVFRATDEAGHGANGEAPVVIRVDGGAPTTTARINGAAPAVSYTAPVSVTLAAADAGPSGVARTELRVDGGSWTAYSGAVTVSGNGNHVVEFRSADNAGNVEPAKQIAFRIGAQQPSPPPPGGDEPPAPAPEPWVNVAKPRRGLSTVAAFRRGRLSFQVRCQSVERGTVRLTVSRKVARKLGLRSTVLASRTVNCTDRSRATVTLKPSAKVRKALARYRKALRATLTVRFSVDGRVTRDSVRVTLRGRR